MRSSLRSGLFLIALVFAFQIPAISQTLGDIAGEVKDQQGASIAAAAVSLTNQSTGASRSTISNDSGSYAFPALQPGVYTVKVENVMHWTCDLIAKDWKHPVLFVGPLDYLRSKWDKDFFPVRGPDLPPTTAIKPTSRRPLDFTRLLAPQGELLAA